MVNLIVTVYPNFDIEYTDWLYLRKRVLALTNDDVNEINSITLSMIPGDVKTYMSYDMLSNSNDCAAFNDVEPPKLLHSLKISRLSNHCLELKVGTSVTLLRNLI